MKVGGKSHAGQYVNWGSLRECYFPGTLRRYHFQTLSARNDKHNIINIQRYKINVYSRHKQSFGRFYALSGLFFMV